jgi:hypothetical protein
MQVVARVVLPVRESLKTEAEVVTMELVRGEIATVVLISELYYLLILYSPKQYTRSTSLLVLLQHTT